MANKHQARIQIPEWLDTRDNCSNCMTPTNLVVETRKGRYYLCSDQCQENFYLKAGLKGYNQIRDHELGPKLETIGKLQALSAEEIKNLYRFKNKLSRTAMNSRKKGDSLDKVLGTIDKQIRKKDSKRVRTMDNFIHLTT